jgi:hypothetical protein
LAPRLVRRDRPGASHGFVEDELAGQPAELPIVEVPDDQRMAGRVVFDRRLVQEPAPST